LDRTELTARTRLAKASPRGLADAEAAPAGQHYVLGVNAVRQWLMALVPEPSGCKAFKSTMSERFVDWLVKVSVFPFMTTCQDGPRTPHHAERFLLSGTATHDASAALET